MSFLYVEVYHGPVHTFCNNVHKPQVLYGLRERLQKYGYRVDLVPVDFANYCMLEVCGHEVFRCNIKHLKFNTPCEKDPVCQRAVEAVIAASIKFRHARSYLWFWTLLEDQMFARGKYGPVDFWPSYTEKKHFQCTTCPDCCNIDPDKRSEFERKRQDPKCISKQLALLNS